MASWKTASDLMDAVHESHKRLIEGKTDVSQAHAEARQLSVAAKIIDIQITHARLTNRLETGSSSLPPLKIR